MVAPIPPRSVVDTLDDGAWSPMRITVRLDEPLVADLHRPLTADGALAWCAWLEYREARRADPPPMRPTVSPLDLDLGLATWTCRPTAEPADGRALGVDGQAWGWAASHHIPVPQARTAVQVRRRPPDREFARLTGEKAHHHGAGPYKARDNVHPAAWIGEITWWALGDPARVAELLTRLTHLGRLGRHGYGRVHTCEVAPGGDRDRWRARSFPAEGGRPDGIRAPYHHPTRRMPCAP